MSESERKATQLRESLRESAADVLRTLDPELSERQLESMIRKWITPGKGPRLNRWQDSLIEQLIPAGSSVLDIGCGDGELLQRLILHKQVRGQGVELDLEAVFLSVARGTPVLQLDVDDALEGFSDHSFDYVVLEETLQTLRRPIVVLSEMLRVGGTGIVSFPNFAHWRVRVELALLGRMPVTPTLPFHWHDTPNIHSLTINDFQQWAESERVEATGYGYDDGLVRPLREGDDLHAEEVLMVVKV